MARRSEVLDFAVLGLLHEAPMHGYELRKRLNTALGTFRALSYGTLYPCLKAQVAAGWIRELEPPAGSEPVAGPLSGPLTGRRGRIVYELTAEGKEHFQSLVSDPGSAAWEDGNFDVRFAFFARTDAATRLQILEGRRSRLQERVEAVRDSMARTRERLDGYTLELQRHGLESAEREVRWLSELIDTERTSRMTHSPTEEPPTRPSHHLAPRAAARPAAVQPIDVQPTGVQPIAAQPEAAPPRTPAAASRRDGDPLSGEGDQLWVPSE